MFLKISQYSQENTEALEALLLQNTCSGCFWIFAAANTFFQLNLVVIADRFFLRTSLKTRVEPQKQPLELFCKKRCSEKFCKFHRKIPVLKSLFNRVAGLEECSFIKKRLQHRCFPVKFPKFIRTHNLRSENDYF